MFQPLSLYIGIRYTCAKRRNHFISFISLASMIGIALGVTVLITVLSVMNGFDYEIHNRIFSMAEQVKISGTGGAIENWQSLNEQVSKEPGVVSAAPFVSGQGMVNSSGEVRGIMISGVLPELENKVSAIHENMLDGNMNNLKAGEFGVVIGQNLAAYLNAAVGDKVVIITPEATSTPVGVLPRLKRFTVVGIFHVGDGDGGMGYDSNVAFIHLNDAQKLLQLGSSVSGLRLRVENLYDAPVVSGRLAKTLSSEYSGEYSVRDWTQEYGQFFKAIQMEKTTMFVVLLFIIAVAAFNLVSSLVMTVNDKRSDIAILRTLGASPKTIMSIFMVQGSVIGIAGTVLGVVGGILLALNAPAIVAAMEHYLNIHFIPASVYFINYLPSKLVWADVVRIGGATLLMSLLATIYPAWRASKTQPAEALRYE